MEIINKVLIDNQSITSIALEYGLPTKSLLSNWIKCYKVNESVIGRGKKGRISTMKNNKFDPNDKDEIMKQKDEET